MTDEPPRQLLTYFPMTNCLMNYCGDHTDCNRLEPGQYTEAQLASMPERKVCVEGLCCITPCSFILDLISLVPRLLCYNCCTKIN